MGSAKRKPLWDKTGKILNACRAVYDELGPGHMEVYYQRALYYEFQALGMEFGREYEIEMYYKGHPIGKRRADFYFGDVILEIKAKSELDKVDFMQTLGYIRAANVPVGLLVNFGAPKLEIKRIINSKANLNRGNHGDLGNHAV